MSLYQCVCAKCKDKFFHEDKRCPICQLCHALDRCETLCQQLTAAQSRVVELEKICTMDGIEDLIKTRDDLTADNARLRESIQSVLCYAHLPQRYRDELEAAIENPHDAT